VVESTLVVVFCAREADELDDIVIEPGSIDRQEDTAVLEPVAARVQPHDDGRHIGDDLDGVRAIERRGTKEALRADAEDNCGFTGDRVSESDRIARSARRRNRSSQKGNWNALKHGLYTAEATETRRAIAALIREARRVTREIS
jgi:hypothetical protein